MVAICPVYYGDQAVLAEAGENFTVRNFMRFHSSPNTVGVIKSRGMRGTGRVEHLRENGNGYTVLARESGGIGITWKSLGVDGRVML